MCKQPTVLPSSQETGDNTDFNYGSGSILDLIAELKLTIEPSSILDVLEKLPSWLCQAMENKLAQTDVSTTSDPWFPVDSPSRTTF